MSATAQEVESGLRAFFGAEARIVVRDDSHLHAGHAGAAEGSHFGVTVASPRFHGLGRAARHRLVYDALRPLLRPGGIHALAITAEDASASGPSTAPDPAP